MLNKEKVRHMTKAAAYEKGPDRNNIKINSYYRTDYLGLQMIKAAVAYVIVFVILVVMWAMGRLEDLMLMISRAEYLKSMARTMGVLFVSGLAIYEILVYIYFSRQFHKAKNSVKGYYMELKNIQKTYEEQESSGKEKAVQKSL